MKRLFGGSYREALFKISIVLKGLDALLEIVGAIALWAIRPGMIVHVVGLLTQDEIAEDPKDLVANFLRREAHHLSLASEHFMAIYLLAHGIVKGLVVIALLREKLWAYPLAIAVFVGFIVYQIYRFTLTGGLGLIGLSLFDLFVVWMVWLEYRALRTGRGHPATAQG
jgi:uncharacterized membrane protein